MIVTPLYCQALNSYIEKNKEINKSYYLKNAFIYSGSTCKAEWQSLNAAYMSPFL